MIALLALLPTATAWIGDDGVYSWSQSGSVDVDAPAHTWVDVPTLPGAILLGVSTIDDGTESLAALGTQSFRFYGVPYNTDQIWVSSNGPVLFTPSSTNIPNYCCSGFPLPTSSLQSPAILPFWTDLNPAAGGDIWVVDTGSEIIISFVAVQFFGSGGAVSAQVGLRPDGSFRISVDDQQLSGNPIAIGHQRDSITGNEVFLGSSAPVPTTWLFVPDSVDDDLDGFSDVDDCDDSDPTVYPGAMDTACDGVIADCVPSTAEDDNDGDGVFICAGDCDDNRSWVYPGAPEQCDSIDNNCDNQIDEGLPLQIYYADTDNDGWGDALGATQLACGPTFGWADPGDCDDTDWTISPWQQEDCDPLVDRNCDGDPILDAFDALPYWVDLDGDGYGPDPVIFACVVPADAAPLGGGDCDDANDATSPEGSEICDGIDNDCDGLIDDEDPDVLATMLFFPDSDGDGVGSAAATPSLFCSPPAGWVSSNTDCDDAEAAAYPGAPEDCDGIDNDCDGLIDDEDPDVLAPLYYPDADEDGAGSAATPGALSCTPLPGFVTSATDCNDADPTIHPTAVEACPDGIDNDCDGLIDADDPDYSDQGVELWFDQDGDGIGTDSLSLIACSTDVLVGYVSPSLGIDCDDNNPTISPLEVEVCDGVDNDCDGQVDEDSVSSPYYPDLDLDGFGDDSATPVLSCAPLPDLVTNSTDCDDTDATINPVTTELCDGVDQNCSGVADDGLPTTTWYVDADADGYGDVDDPGTSTCDSLSGSVSDNTDCDDDDADINPGVDEVLDDGIDNDCDGVAQDAPVVDTDGDGVPDDIDPAPNSAGDRAPPADPAPDYGCGGCGVASSGGSSWALILVGLGLIGRRR